MPGETETLPGQTETPAPDLGLRDAELPPAGQEQAASQAASEEERPSAEQEQTEAPTLEDFQSFLQEHDEEREHEWRTEQGRKQSRIARSHEESMERAQAANQALQVQIPQLIRAVQDADERTASQLALQLNPALQKLGDEFLRLQTEATSKGILENIASALGAEASTHEDFVWDVLHARNEDDAKTAVNAFITRLTRERDKKLRAESVAEWENRSMERRDKETRAGERGRQAPPANTAGRAGQTRPDRELLMDPNTPIETIREIRTRQKAGT